MSRPQMPQTHPACFLVVSPYHEGAILKKETGTLSWRALVTTLLLSAPWLRASGRLGVQLCLTI